MTDVYKDSTSHTYYFELVDSSTGLPKTAIVHTDVTASYVRTRSARTAITPATLASASAAWSSGGFILVDDTNQPGVYRFDVPDAAFATGVDEVIVTVKATGCRTQSRKFTLVNMNNQVAWAPNAAANANGGLPILSSSGTTLDYTITTVTTVNGLAAGVITAASIAADAITDAKVASDVTIASVTGAVGSVTGSVGSITTGGITTASFAAGAIDAAAIATDAIGSDEISAAAVTKIQAGLSTLTQSQVSGGAYALNSALFTFNAALDFTTAQKAATLARVTLTDTLTTYTGNTPQTADHAANIAAILVDTAEIGAAGAGLTALATAANLATVAGYLDTEIAAILADTNELQSDWVNGGRLDVILDARSSQTSVDELPTNAELATALGTADDAVLAAIAALNDITAGEVRTELATELARIDAAVSTRATPAQVATELGTYDAPTKAELDTAIDALPTAAENAAALLDLSNGIETSITPRQAMRLILAAAAGKLSGAATTTITIRNVGDSKDRLTATVDADGNRSAVTVDGT